MTLPEYKESKYKQIPPGEYILRILDPPRMERKYGKDGKKVGIHLKVFAMSEDDGSTHETELLIFPWYKEYRTLKDEIIKSDEETDWVGRSFRAHIIVEPNPQKQGRMLTSLDDVRPFEKEESEPEPELEVEDTTITPNSEKQDKDTTPPPEEPDDPGPEEEDPYPKEKDEDEPPF